MSDKTGTLGYWIPADMRRKELAEAIKPTQTKLSDKKPEIQTPLTTEQMSDILSDKEEPEPLDPCEICKKPVETKKTWEDGEEHIVCYSCIVIRYGKLANTIWRKMK